MNSDSGSKGNVVIDSIVAKVVPLLVLIAMSGLVIKCCELHGVLGLLAQITGCGTIFSAGGLFRGFKR